MTRTSRWLMALVLSAGSMGPVLATHLDTVIYKCKAGVFQDHPCAGAIAATAATAQRSPEHKKVYDEVALERKLDQLQALGVGLIQPVLPKAQPPAAPPPKPAGHDFYKPKPRLSWMEREAQEQSTTERLQAQTEHNNAVAAAQLGQIVEQREQQCGGKLAQLPVVGMSDKTFRQCTLLAQFGEIAQIVVSEEDGVAARLYVFPTEKVRRVYSIDGVVTAVKP